MLWISVKNSSSNCRSEDSESAGSFINRPTSTNLRYASPSPPTRASKTEVIVNPRTLYRSEVPAVKLERPVSKWSTAQTVAKVPAGVR